jgi:nitroreductase
MSINPEDFSMLVKMRRSVFPDQFDTTRKVPDEIILQIVENATWAPNHGQAEPWEFTVFSREGLQQLALFQSSLYQQESGADFNEGKYKKLLQQPLKASHVISIGMKRTLTKRIPEIEDVEAVACAVQNIYLSVTSFGLGGYWTTGGVTYYDEAKYFFGLKEEDKLLGFFYIGYVAVPSPAAKRSPLEEKIKWVTK